MLIHTAAEFGLRAIGGKSGAAELLK